MGIWTPSGGLEVSLIIHGKMGIRYTRAKSGNFENRTLVFPSKMGIYPQNSCSGVAKWDPILSRGYCISLGEGWKHDFWAFHDCINYVAYETYFASPNTSYVFVCLSCSILKKYFNFKSKFVEIIFLKYIIQNRAWCDVQITQDFNQEPTDQSSVLDSQSFSF